MSLILISEPEKELPREANDLDQGQWFIDEYGQIYLIALDDITNEKRVVCAGDYCQPFIPSISARHIKVERILPSGTMLQITTAVPLLEGR